MNKLEKLRILNYRYKLLAETEFVSNEDANIIFSGKRPEHISFDMYKVIRSIYKILGNSTSKEFIPNTGTIISNKVSKHDKKINHGIHLQEQNM